MTTVKVISTMPSVSHAMMRPVASAKRSSKAAIVCSRVIKCSDKNGT
jgi:hypothetical protein